MPPLLDLFLEEDELDPDDLDRLDPELLRTVDLPLERELLLLTDEER
ncbi:MAG: hypothetical protein ACPGGA_08540 [Balneolaceae bacterium]